MTTTLEEPKVKRVELLRIMPYLNPDITDNDSIQAQLINKHHMVLHEGATQKEYLTCIERNGVKQYLSGLNEFAPEVQGITDPDKKSATIKSIRKNVAFLEQAMGANTIDSKLINSSTRETQKEFWDNVKIVHPNNHTFWDTVFVLAGNDPVFLNPKDPHDLIKICGIEAGGFSLISKSYEDARMSPNPPRFYLDKSTDTAATKTEVKKLKNKALASLSDLFDKNPTKLFYVIKNVDSSNSYQYKNSTSNDIMYDYLDTYISGAGYEKSAKKAAMFFNQVCELSEEELRIKAVMADAHFYKIIAMKGDSMYYHRASDTMLGKNSAEMISYFKDSMNAKVWQLVLDEVEVHWKD